MSLSKQYSLSWRYLTAVLLVGLVVIASARSNHRVGLYNKNHRFLKTRQHVGRHQEEVTKRRLIQHSSRLPYPSYISRVRARPISVPPRYSSNSLESIQPPIRIRKVLTERNGVLSYKEISSPKQYSNGFSRLPDIQRSLETPHHAPLTRRSKGQAVNAVALKRMKSRPRTLQTARVFHRGQSRRIGRNYRVETRRNKLPFAPTPNNVFPSPRELHRSARKFVPISEEKLDLNKNIRIQQADENFSKFRIFKPPIDPNMVPNTDYITGLVPSSGFKVTLLNGKNTSLSEKLRSTGRPVTRINNSSPVSLMSTYPPTRSSSPEILRIQTTSMSEAQALLSGIGKGFKVSIIDGTRGNLLKEGSRHTTPDPTRSSSSVILKRHSLITTKAPKRRKIQKEWWKGPKICVSKSPGLFGLTEMIMKKVRTTTTCTEKRATYICTEKYGFGKHSPSSTTTYRCCAGFSLSLDRSQCAPTYYGFGSSASSLGSTWVNRMTHTDTLMARSAPEKEILTIFMPDDDVVIEAFTSQNGSEIGDSSQVQAFLENHVISDKKLLSTQMENDQIFTAISGNKIRVNFFSADFENVMTVNCRKVAIRDVVNDNSVVHFIDDVIKKVHFNIFDFLSDQSDDFSIFLSVLQNSDYKRKLQATNGSLTLFAPTNDAFQDFPVSAEPGACLEALIQNHLVGHVICTAGTDTRKRNMTNLQGETLILHQNNDKIFINDATITRNDVMTTNGVVHVINKVLKPSSVSSMLDVLSGENRLTTIIEMFQAAGIKNALATGNNFTLIVPTNRAFKKIPKKQLTQLVRYTEDLRSVLMYHLIPERIEFKELRSGQILETLNPPKDIHVSKYSRKVRAPSKGKKIYLRKPVSALQCAMVLGQPKTKPCNGAILVVNKVMLPPSGSLLSTMMYSKKSNFSTFLKAVRRTELEYILDGEQVFTLFAPSDAAFSRFPQIVTQKLLTNKKLLLRVIKFHLVPGFHCAHELLQKSYRHATFLGSKLTSCPKRKRIYLGRRKKRLRAKVVEGDMIATNGIIHAIDNLLLPRKFKLF